MNKYRKGYKTKILKFLLIDKNIFLFYSLSFKMYKQSTNDNPTFMLGYMIFLHSYSSPMPKVLNLPNTANLETIPHVMVSPKHKIIFIVTL